MGGAKEKGVIIVGKDCKIREYLQSHADAAKKAKDEGMRIGICERYPFVETYVLEQGKQFESAELTAVEKKWVKQIDLRSHKKQECFRNAQLTATFALSMDGVEVRYVEGFVQPAIPIPVLHAWISINGKVVDTTLKPDDGAKGRVFGTIPDGWEYYGVEMPTSMCQHVFEHQVHISLIDDYQCHWPMLQNEEG